MPEISERKVLYYLSAKYSNYTINQAYGINALQIYQGKPYDLYYFKNKLIESRRMRRGWRERLEISHGR